MRSLQPGAFTVLLGEELANKLGVGLGDAVVVAVAKGNVTPAGVLPRLRRFKVAGIFRSGMYEIDATLAVVHVADAARLLRLGDNVTGLRLAVRDPYEAPLAVREVASELGGGLYVEDWTQRNANFFRSIELTKRMMFFILLLVVAVAAFNIVSTLVMAVKDKQPDIAILRTIGARPASILAIFTTQGTVIGLLGTLGGVAARRAAVDEPRVDRARPRAGVRRAFHGRERVPDERPAGARRTRRRAAHRRHGVRAVLSVHPVSRVARGDHRSGEGPAP